MQEEYNIQKQSRKIEMDDRAFHMQNEVEGMQEQVREAERKQCKVVEEKKKKKNDNNDNDNNHKNYNNGSNDKNYNNGSNDKNLVCVDE